MHHLMDKAVKQNARVVFIGDGKQLQAIAAGKMFKDLQQHGRTEVIILDEVLRQKTPAMKRLVGHISNYHSGRDAGGIDKAFDVLKEQQAIKFSNKASKRVGEAVAFYLSSDHRDKSLIVTPLNEDRIEINNQIRSAIKAERNIKKEIETTVKIPVSMVGTKPFFARNYKTGQDIFVTSSTLSDLKAGSEATIVATNERLNTITLDTGNGKTVTVDLQANAADLSVYSKEQRKFFKGDRLVFLKNDKMLGVQNSLTGKVEQIGINGVFTVKVDGKEQRIKFHKDKFQYYDYGYAVTVHKSQGQTSKSVAFVTDRKSPLNKFESFYTAMTRAEEKAVLICDNPNDVKLQFKQEQGKTSVIEFAKQDMQISLNRELGK
jgi:ATP-dependent exoDNAse (exonuclease V) alpha subunit